MDLKRFATRALYATLMTGGLTILGCGVAHAAETGGDDGVLSGTQGVISIEAPVDLAGNGISVLGDASSSDAETAAAPAAAPAGEAPATSGDEGIGSGSQAVVDVSAPVTIGGNSISVVGDTSSEGATTEQAPAPAAPAEAPAETSGDDAVLGGTQGLVEVAAPVTVGGNAISVLGDADSEGASNEATTGDGGASAGSGDASTSGEEGVLGGTQIVGGVEAPVTVGGNAISVLGDSSTEGTTTTVAPGTGTGSGSGTGAWTTGEDGIAGGTQVLPDAAAPVTVGGNAISILGDSSTEGTTTGVAPGTGTGSGSGASTTGEDGIAGGTQVLPDVTAPVTVGGNAISVTGDASSNGTETVVIPGAGDSSDATTGSESLLGGSQIVPVVELPITVGGNAISVIGDSETDGSTTVVVPTEPTVPGTPADPTYPTEPGTPVDPTDPVDPVDPSDPATPTVPGTPGDGEADWSMGAGFSVAGVGDVTVIAAGASSTGLLASTGTETAALGVAGGLLLLAGLVFFGFRRFAARN